MLNPKEMGQFAYENWSKLVIKQPPLPWKLLPKATQEDWHRLVVKILKETGYRFPPKSAPGDAEYKYLFHEGNPISTYQKEFLVEAAANAIADTAKRKETIAWIYSDKFTYRLAVQLASRWGVTLPDNFDPIIKDK